MQSKFYGFQTFSCRSPDYLFKYQWGEIDLPWKLILIAFESLVGYLKARVKNLIVLDLIVPRGPLDLRLRSSWARPTFDLLYLWGLRLGQKVTKQKKDEKWIGSARPGQMSSTSGVLKPSHRPGFFFFSPLALLQDWWPPASLPQNHQMVSCTVMLNHRFLCK